MARAVSKADHCRTLYVTDAIRVPRAMILAEALLLILQGQPRREGRSIELFVLSS